MPIGDENFMWWWATGTSEPEIYHGPCNTREEAIDEARGNDGRELGFVIVEADRWSARHATADTIRTAHNGRTPKRPRNMRTRDVGLPCSAAARLLTRRLTIDRKRQHTIAFSCRPTSIRKCAMLDLTEQREEMK